MGLTVGLGVIGVIGDSLGRFVGDAVIGFGVGCEVVGSGLGFRVGFEVVSVVTEPDDDSTGLGAFSHCPTAVHISSHLVPALNGLKFGSVQYIATGREAMSGVSVHHIHMNNETTQKASYLHG